MFLLMAGGLLLRAPVAAAQQISRDELLFLTPEWEGERYDDGRPRVPDGVLERMKLVTIEEAWAVLRGERFNYQFEGGWMTINPDSVLVGRALTATFVPGRPDIHRVIDERGHERDNRTGAQNALERMDGFSEEVGAFVAGVALGSSTYREAIATRLTTLRDFLLLFFFVQLGLGIDLEAAGGQLGPALVLAAFVLLAKPLVLMASMGALGYRRRTSFLTGVSRGALGQTHAVHVPQPG